MKIYTHHLHLQLLLGPVNVQQRRDPDQKPPPRPVSHQHEFSDVPLDTPDRQILKFSLG